ncbi:MerR family transcriptional regulator [Gordonia sp. TBRC 11910]|uniref:MerR family transcriptional regulator n=1 Tax=Gordonia asplenii TaxID=2725283 RepID=A0A848KT97_9ACTN|nr:MerR family transcriptional regulator [Gordonia asplenii]NMO02164.1 MerR family transcriptional regulator [Gordonia asplenii]
MNYDIEVLVEGLATITAGDDAQSRQSVLSTSEVAAHAGCSVQHVRDLEARGVLPPVRRAANNYRRYDRTHVLSVRAYRGFAAGAGFGTARAILQSIHGGDVAAALAMLDAAHADVHAERDRILRAQSAADSIAAEPIIEPSPDDSMTIGELSRALGLPTSTLRFWESQRLIDADRSDGARVFGPAQIRDVRIVAQLRAAGYGIGLLRELLPQLTSGSSNELGEILDRRRRCVDARSQALVAGAASLHALIAGVE